MTTSNLC